MYPLVYDIKQQGRTVNLYRSICYNKTMENNAFLNQLEGVETCKHIN